MPVVCVKRFGGGCAPSLRKEMGVGLVNGRTAEVEAVRERSLAFRLEDGCLVDSPVVSSQVRYMAHLWASPVRALAVRGEQNEDWSCHA